MWFTEGRSERDVNCGVIYDIWHCRLRLIIAFSIKFDTYAAVQVRTLRSFANGPASVLKGS